MDYDKALFVGAPAHMDVIAVPGGASAISVPSFDPDDNITLEGGKGWRGPQVTVYRLFRFRWDSDEEMAVYSCLSDERAIERTLNDVHSRLSRLPQFIDCNVPIHRFTVACEVAKNGSEFGDPVLDDEYAMLRREWMSREFRDSIIAALADAVAAGMMRR